MTSFSNSSKATSPRDFVATWGFCHSATLWQKAQKQQVCPFSYVLGAFCPSHKKNSFCHRISEFLKSNKYPCFRGDLGLLPLRDVSAKSEKATSLSIFLYTWGFSSFSQEEFVLSSHLRIPQKQQVPLISRQLVAFSAPRRCGRKLKSNKSIIFSIYLGLFVLLTRRIRSVIASPNSSKATSTRDFVATWGFCRSRRIARNLPPT